MQRNTKQSEVMQGNLESGDSDQGAKEKPEEPSQKGQRFRNHESRFYNCLDANLYCIENVTLGTVLKTFGP